MRQDKKKRVVRFSALILSLFFSHPLALLEPTSATTYKYTIHTPIVSFPHSFRNQKEPFSVLLTKLFWLEMDYDSGCESGWTMYLENSLIPPCTTYSHGNEFLHKSMINKHEEEEEDLSMVSDASSGPPQAFGEEEFGLCYDNSPIDAALLLPAKVDAKSHKKKPNRREKLKEKASSALDDTASSPIFTSTHNNFSQKNNHSSGENVVVPGFSHGYSTTQFHGQSTHHQEHSELFQLQPNQWFEKRWGY